MLIPFRFTLYQAAAAPGEVLVPLTGVAADPQIGDGTVDIGGAVVVPPVEELVIGGRRWYGILEDEIVYLTGVAANPRIGSGTVGRREISERLYFPKRQPEPIDSSGVVGDLAKLKILAKQKPLAPVVAPVRPAPVIVPKKPTVFVQLTGVEVARVEKIIERFEEEMLAFLDAA